MNSVILVCCIICSCICLSLSDPTNLQDTCPTGPQPAFINGLLCKSPSTITAADFKSTKLREAGDTDNFLGSAVSLATAIDFPGLNTLGLSVARTDLEVDGMVMPHSHPRATEILFVFNGTVLAGFIDTNKQLFQKLLKQGDVIVFPRGLLHFCLNAGYEVATAFSVLNSQNPGVVSITDATFTSGSAEDVMENMKRGLITATEFGIEHFGDATSSGFTGFRSG